MEFLFLVYLLICWRNRDFRTKYGKRTTYQLAKHESVRLEEIEVSPRSFRHVDGGVRIRPENENCTLTIPYSAVNFIEVREEKKREISYSTGVLNGIGIAQLKNPNKLVKIYEAREGND